VIQVEFVSILVFLTTKHFIHLIHGTRSLICLLKKNHQFCCLFWGDSYF